GVKVIQISVLNRLYIVSYHKPRCSVFLNYALAAGLKCILGEEIAGDELVKVLQIKEKIPRRKALSSLEEEVLSILSETGYVSKDEVSETTPDLFEDEDEDEEVVLDGEIDEGDVHIKPVSRKSAHLLFSELDVKVVFKEVTSKFLRRRIVEGGKRSDGRASHDIRLINSRCGLLPRAHGSTLFTRGETQSLAVVTLGDKQMAQRIDNLVDEDDVKRFYLQRFANVAYSEPQGAWYDSD
ncbi:unnamed protein product, partial [Ilex paraguariensis]